MRDCRVHVRTECVARDIPSICLMRVNALREVENDENPIDILVEMELNIGQNINSSLFFLFLEIMNLIML